MGIVVRGCAVGSLILLASCADTEPWTRPGSWTETGANAANLAAMVADPGDLAFGRASSGSSGVLAVAAIERLRQGQVKPLPESGFAPSQSPPGPNAAPPAAGSSGP